MTAARHRAIARAERPAGRVDYEGRCRWPWLAGRVDRTDHSRRVGRGLETPQPRDISPLSIFVGLRPGRLKPAPQRQRRDRGGRDHVAQAEAGPDEERQGYRMGGRLQPALRPAGPTPILAAIAARPSRRRAASTSSTTNQRRPRTIASETECVTETASHATPPVKMTTRPISMAANDDRYRRSQRSSTGRSRRPADTPSDSRRSGGRRSGRAAAARRREDQNYDAGQQIRDLRDRAGRAPSTAPHTRTASGVKRSGAGVNGSGTGSAPRP